MLKVKKEFNNGQKKTNTIQSYCWGKGKQA